MEAMRQLITRFWHFLPVTIILYLSLFTHFTLAFVALARRTSWNLPKWQLAQYVLGFSVPLLLIPHVIGARLTPALLETVEGGYQWVLGAIWNTEGLLFWQSLMLLIVWSHFCCGIHFWLRIRAGYRRWLSLWHILAIVIPLLALLGVYRAAFEVGDIDLGERWQRVSAGYPEVVEQLLWADNAARNLFWGCLLLVAIYHAVRIYQGRRRTTVWVNHPNRGLLNTLLSN